MYTRKKLLKSSCLFFILNILFTGCFTYPDSVKTTISGLVVDENNIPYSEGTVQFSSLALGFNKIKKTYFDKEISLKKDGTFQFEEMIHERTSSVLKINVPSAIGPSRKYDALYILLINNDGIGVPNPYKMEVRPGDNLNLKYKLLLAKKE